MAMKRFEEIAEKLKKGQVSDKPTQQITKNDFERVAKQNQDQSKPVTQNRFEQVAARITPEEKKPSFFEEVGEGLKQAGKASLDIAIGVSDVPGTVGSGIVQMFNPVPGLVGIYKGIKGGSIEETSKGIAATQEAFKPFFNYEPQSSSGKEALRHIQNITDFLITKPSEKLGEVVQLTEPILGRETAAALATVAKIGSEFAGYSALFGSLGKLKTKLVNGEPLLPAETRIFEDHLIKVSRVIQETQQKALSKTRLEAAEVIKDSPIYGKMSEAQRADATEYLARSLAGIENPKPSSLNIANFVKGAEWYEPKETVFQQIEKIVEVPSKKNTFQQIKDKLFVDNPIREGVRDLMRERSVNIDFELLRGQKIIRDITRDLSELEEHAVTFLLEGVKDREVIAKYGGKGLADLVSRPSKKISKAVEQARKYYDEAFKTGKEVFDGLSFQENYVNHIWNFGKADNARVSNAFKTTNPFFKKRSVMSLEHGLAEGLRPKTTKIAEVMSAYHGFLVRSVENKKFAESLKNTLWEDGKPLLRVEGETGVGKDWSRIEHPIFDKVVFGGKAEKVITVKSLVVQIRETIEKLKTVANDGEWKPANVSKQISSLENVIHGALRSRGMTEAEASVYLNKLKSAYSGKEFSGKPSESIEQIKRTLNQTVKEISSKEVVDIPILRRKNVMAPSEIASDLENILGKRFDHTAIKSIEIVNSFLKKTWLSISMFHHAALTEVASSGRIATKALSLFNPYKAFKAISKKDYDLFKDMKISEDAIKKGGVKFGDLEDYQVGVVRKALNGMENALKDVPIAGKIAKGLRKGNELWDEGLWNYLHNSLKLAGYEEAKISAINSLSKKLGRDLTKKELDAVKADVGSFINDSYGGQNWELNFVLGNPKMRQIMQGLFLSPDWLYSTIKQPLAPFISTFRIAKFNKLANTMLERGDVVGASKALVKKMGNKALQKESLKFWGLAATYFFTITNTINYYNTKRFHGKGRFTWENPNGHELDVMFGYNDDGTERYLRFGKHSRELPEWIMHPTEKFGGKLGPVASEFFTQLSKHEPGSGFPTEFSEKAFWESLPLRAKSVATLVIPFSLRPYIEETPKQFLWAIPASRGLSAWKTKELFKQALEDGDNEQVVKIFVWGLENGHNSQEIAKQAASEVKRKLAIDDREIAKKILKELEEVDPTAKLDLVKVYSERGILSLGVKEELQKILEYKAGVRELQKTTGIKGAPEK